MAEWTSKILVELALVVKAVVVWTLIFMVSLISSRANSTNRIQNTGYPNMSK